MIKGKGKIRNVGILQDSELTAALQKMKPGDEWDFLLTYDRGNRQLPQLTYLFSVVLKAISDKLPDHPSTISLYRYFEDLLAPRHDVTINGTPYTYKDLKSEKSVDINVFVEKVVETARESWGIEIPTQAHLGTAEERDTWSMVYRQQEVDWCNFLSSRNNKSNLKLF